MLHIRIANGAGREVRAEDDFGGKDVGADALVLEVIAVTAKGAVIQADEVIAVTAADGELHRGQLEPLLLLRVLVRLGNQAVIGRTHSRSISFDDAIPGPEPPAPVRRGRPIAVGLRL
jgi:hypothetical protein